MLARVIDFAIGNRFLVILGSLLLLAAGLYAADRLAVDAVPDVTNVQVQVMTTAPALGPLEVEQGVTIPVEAAMSGLPRVEEIRSVSQFGLSVVTVVFEEGTDIFWARQQVNERLAEARERIPPGVPAPKPGPIATGLGEIYQFEVRNKPGYSHPLMKLREILDWQIAPQLRGVPGVIEVNTNGGQLRAYEVRPDPEKLRAFNIPLEKLFTALHENNANEGGGYLLLKSQEQRIVRAEGRISSLDDVRNVVLDARGDGTPVYVHQVADVQFGPVLRQGATTRDGRGEAVVGVVMLLAGENSRAVVRGSKEKMEEIKKTLPEGVEIDVVYDRTELVERTVHTLKTNLVEGGVLVVVVLLVLLGSLRAGLIVALAVPLAMAGAFVGMWYAGLSGNLMSLGAIDFGLIVDGSVVLIENVVRRVAEHRHHHRDDRAPLEVVRDACREVARPVVFGVGIILLVYLPILSLRGVEGKMFKPMALTVIFALLSSLALALFLMPVLAAIFLRSVSEHEPLLVRLAKAVYRPLLGLAVGAPRAVVLASAATFLLSAWTVQHMGAVFIPKLDEGSVAIQATRLPSASLETSVQMTTRLEQCLREMPEVDSVVSKSGRPEIANDPMTINLTDVIVTLKPNSTWRFASKEELVKAMEEKLEAEVPGQVYAFSQPIELRVAELVAGVKADVGISVYGDDLDQLRATAEEVAAAVGKVPGAADVAVEQTGGLPYLRVILKRDALARHGINARAALDAVAVVGGKDVGEVYEGQRRFPLQVRFPEAVREDLGRLKKVTVPDAKGRPIPLEQLAELRFEDGPGQISRDAIRRRAVVSCNVRGRDLAGFVADAQKTVDEKVKLPTGYSVAWGGQFKNLQEATKRLSVAVPVALLMIFVLLHSTFNSTKLAALIFLNVPLAASGGVFALWLRGMDLSISAGVGFIALFGVAVLNGVVLVTYVVELRKSGADPLGAAFEGAMMRVRPVLMTALVATLGFIPMALSSGSGAEVQKPLATVVIGGLVTSTLLTLFVIPAVYRWFDPEPATAAAEV
ncbi:Cobalt-zinc-cadmium resistance protein CzcA [Gemmata obscuriglobus]|uniref:CusA/CzcA family heavy metal efflux RND transporter n=1 Tax=Gemmata obscuriglobus TaxID=114 RepID=A0A2Z3H8B2_9BACT|nr:CusA/CzcA family heavy metal efflux RND transporter [Gemmata obscuriglobus]AWM37290.1 CusA/CzcA family heavy metal efflux RND transporter [Gemmata obscuriglobus]QEG29963.1 Cobalt-zinc-cadmium resistance protein CzcA [Gemmata obscuriglobus]VTS09282.1 cation transporter : Heavy metal efflux pump, CzcA family OS=Planctomyces limnophilus (strain ATCC 43296 / DSM 3776 / IFAM 1008 / 290) GN=Plim_1583 PE=4 SV=1: ACR_tran [Gemmata obscuriglobus UQM 2246]